VLRILELESGNATSIPNAKKILFFTVPDIIEYGAWKFILIPVNKSGCVMDEENTVILASMKITS
jgi:hypothetical protein